jgi:RNA polymerase sigma-70 factor (ECF subfamily)
VSSPPNDPERFLAHGTFVRALARHLVRGAARADDVVQETWLAALEHPPRTDEAPRSWLAKVLRNFARRSARSEFRRARREEAAARPEALPSTEEIVERETARRRVLEAVLGLEEPYRSAILLRYHEELPPRAIAKRLGVPVETVRTRLKRAIERLRARLDEDWGGNRRAWCVALGRLAFSRGAVPLAGAMAGVAAMKVATQLAIAAAVLLGLTLALWPKGPAPLPLIDRASTAAVPSESGTGNFAAAHTGSPQESSSPRTPAGPEGRAASTAGGSARGLVLDGNGSPIPGARIVSYPGNVTRAVRPSDASNGAEPLSKVATDREGRFQIPLAGRAPEFALFAEADGFSPAAVESVHPGEDVTITLDTARTVVGTVTDRERRPVAGARVRWLGLMGAARVEREAISGSDGGYRLDGVPPQWTSKGFPPAKPWWIEVRADGFAPLMLERPMGRPMWEVESPFDLVLVRGATLRGRVLDAETDSPVPRARVFLWSNEGMMILGFGGSSSSLPNPWGQRSLGESLSDDDGSFAFEHVPSEGFHPSASHGAGQRGTLVGYAGAKAPGFAPAAEEVVLVPDGGLWEVTLRLWPASSVRGRVVDGSGKPAAGVKVWAYSMERKRAWFPDLFEGVSNPIAETDADGRYAIADVQSTRAPAVIRLKATARGSETGGEVELAVRAGEKAQAPDIRLRTDACVDLVVTDTRGSPIWGAAVEGLHLGLISQNKWTDEAGHARLFFPEWRVRKGPVSLVVRAQGFSPGTAPEFVPSEEDPPEVRVVLGPPHRLAGLVLSAEGTPVQGSWVSVLNPVLSLEGSLSRMFVPDEQPGSPPLRLYGSTKSKEDGRFEVRDLPEGPYNLVALWVDTRDAGGRGGEVRAGARGVGTDATDVVLRLPLSDGKSSPRVAVEGSVTDAETRTPLLDFAVSLEDGSRKIWGEKKSLGRFRVEAPPGVWTLRVSAGGFVAWERPEIDFVPGTNPEPIAATLDRGARVRGVVRAAWGELEDVVVQFREDGRSDGPRARVGKDGSYEATGFRPGRYGVELKTYRFRGEPSFAPSQPRDLVVGEGERTVVLDLDAVPAGQLWVRVQSERLPAPEWTGKVSAEAERRNGAAARLEVRDGTGRIAWLWTNLAAGFSYDTNVPAGVYRIRLEIPGAGPVEREAVVEEGKRVDVELEDP